MYDKQDDDQKKLLEVTFTTGFYKKLFIYDRLHQLSLETMKWIDAANFGESHKSSMWKEKENVLISFYAKTHIP